MIRPLRKRHRLIWIGIAIVLPITFFNAYMVSDQTGFANNASMKFDIEAPASAIKAEGAHFSYTIMNDRNNFLIEIVLDKPYQSPSVALYIASSGTSSLDGFTILGAFSDAGTYRFNLGQSIENKQLIVYDEIKDNTITSINLK